MRKVNNIHVPFKITSVCKADILGLEKQTKDGDVLSRFTEEEIMNLTDVDMDRLASKLADDYCNQMYWSSLELLTEQLLEDKNGK